MPADSRVTGKIAEKSSHSVTYSADTIASWGAEDKISSTKSRPSVTGSLYYTASESEGRSELGSVYDAASLPDSDKDFQIEVATTSKHCCNAHAYAVCFVKPGRTLSSRAVYVGHMLCLQWSSMLCQVSCICKPSADLFEQSSGSGNHMHRATSCSSHAHSVSKSCKSGLLAIGLGLYCLLCLMPCRQCCKR